MDAVAVRLKKFCRQKQIRDGSGKKESPKGTLKETSKSVKSIHIIQLRSVTVIDKIYYQRYNNLPQVIINTTADTN